MIKAVFLDFYGTVVHEDGEIIKRITQKIYDTGQAEDRSEIGQFWWGEFQSMCTNAFGEAFKTQREIERRSLEYTIQRFDSEADALKLSSQLFEYWRKPEIFEDAREFFARCPIPIYIVSNIDTLDIRTAIEYHGLAPVGVFTSEDARAYKPREEIFQFALAHIGVNPKEVIHIGDSISSDVQGAVQAGIPALWLNRSGREVPDGVRALRSLPDALEILNFY